MCSVGHRSSVSIPTLENFYFYSRKIWIIDFSFHSRNSRPEFQISHSTLEIRDQNFTFLFLLSKFEIRILYFSFYSRNSRPEFQISLSTLEIRDQNFKFLFLLSNLLFLTLVNAWAGSATNMRCFIIYPLVKIENILCWRVCNKVPPCGWALLPRGQVHSHCPSHRRGSGTWQVAAQGPDGEDLQILVPPAGEQYKVMKAGNISFTPSLARSESKDTRSLCSTLPPSTSCWKRYWLTFKMFSWFFSEFILSRSGDGRG